jgi:hypothetical protein
MAAATQLSRSEKNATICPVDKLDAVIGDRFQAEDCRNAAMAA